jgi:molecular chaperone GrpE (heat shock protein)
MRIQLPPKLPKWPFLLGDALLLGLAVVVYLRGAASMGHWEILACALCIIVGAGLSVLPFLLEYRAVVRLSEASSLGDAMVQFKNLEQLAAQIGYATNQWQVVRESADKTANVAREIASGMAAEVKGFNEFLQRANESEKATLRLEVDKLRRAEGEWLQVLVRMLDHIYALHQAALRSRQPGIAEELGKFQNACHDAARRVGLTPFVAVPAEPFDAQRHQLLENDAKPPADASVDETIASGYTFQGRLLRPAVVKLRNGNGHEAGKIAAVAIETPDASGEGEGKRSTFNVQRAS